jgi:Arc/MetJ family transcription regulator
LRSMYQLYILIHMKTTLNIDDALLAEAARLTRVSEKTALVRAGLEALIARESARRLSQLGGTERGLRPIPRRRGTRRKAS